MLYIRLYRIHLSGKEHRALLGMRVSILMQKYAIVIAVVETPQCNFTEGGQAKGNVIGK